jgi:sugar phosphate isomerase/epimerase
VPSLKGRLPFTLSTTSFIYPESYANNVRRLGPLVDEIELLLFEKGSLPAATEIKELSMLASDYNLSFNIHLPLDIHLTAESASQRAQAVEVLMQVFELTSPLAPSTHTLHLPYLPESQSENKIRDWQAIAIEGLNQLLNRGIKSNRISLETLDYPFSWLHPVISATNIPICLDVGHILCHGFNLREALRLFDNKIVIMHLHGVQKKVDHMALDQLDPEFIGPVLKMLYSFAGIVSLEVFSHDDLMGSLKFLQHYFAL